MQTLFNENSGYSSEYLGIPPDTGSQAEGVPRCVSLVVIITTVAVVWLS